MRTRATLTLATLAVVFSSTTESLAQIPSSAPSGPIAQLKAAPRAPTAAASGENSTVAKINSWTLGLATGLPEGSFLRFGAELARHLNEPEELRILPIVTPGAVDNVRDLLYLKGVDIAFTNADVLEYFKTDEKIANIEKRVNYISEMYLGDIHLLVRPEINSLKDLEGKKVSFHSPGSGAAISGPVIFRKLGIKVEGVFVNNAIALEQMKTGELVGLVNPGGKPQDLFNKFKNDSGFKFLPIPFEKFDQYYVPTVFTEKDYPGYIKPGETVESIAVPVVLAVYNWPKESDRFRRVERFIDHYFDRMEGLHKPPYNSKWRAINLAAKVPGWTRYWVAEEKLKSMAAAKAAASRPLDLHLARQQATRAAPEDTAEQERLFREFLEWSKRQRKQ